MASLSIDGRTLSKDLDIMADVCESFLARGQAAEIRKAKAFLDAALDQAAWSPDISFLLDVQTKPSDTYKGSARGKHFISGELHTELKCHIVNNMLIVSEGACVMTLSSDDYQNRKVVHFDVCTGGNKDSAGHPPFHAQFYGFANDIPRIPSFIVHPLDILDFLLADLFQDEWRSHLAQHKIKSRLRLFPNRQASRLKIVLNRLITAVDGFPQHGISALQQPYASPVQI